MSKVVIYGYNGWIGNMFQTEFARRNEVIEVLEGKSRLGPNSISHIYTELLAYSPKPTHVLCCVGRTHGDGIPTIDYLEQPGKLKENLNDNLFAPISLALVCKELNIHFSYIGTGCIFNDEPSKEYTAESIPDFFGSSYSTVKGFTDCLMHLSPLCDSLNFRIRMPIVSYKHPRNFITKITSYKSICSMPNSMTVLDEMIPVMAHMILNKMSGTHNMTNPGYISHNEILDMYTELVDPEFTYQNFSITEQDQVLASKRSNNHLHTDFSFLGPRQRQPSDIKTAIEGCLKKYSNLCLSPT